MNIIRQLLNKLKQILRIHLNDISDLIKMEKYSKDLIETIHYARDIYYKNILPLITVEATGSAILNLITDNISSNRKIKIYIFDGKYYIPTYNALNLITKTGFQKYLKYRSEVFDCDDYAFGFKAYASEIFLINSVGIAIGNVIDQEGKTGYHAWNIAFISTKDGIKPVTIEPQTGNWSYGLETKVGDWIYKPDLIII